MRTLRWGLAGALVVLVSLVCLFCPEVRAEQIFQNAFESRGPFWKPGSSDAVSQVVSHKLTDETAHGGQRCEHLRLQIEKGTFLHYTLDLPRAPINEELNLGLWVKSNRPGIQLLCRIVFPRERDPRNLGQPLTVLARCEPYNSTRWKLLHLQQPVKRLREQQQLLNHQIGREIVTTGAYIDQLVLNVCDGTGQIDVWIDDLEIGPVVESSPLPTPTLVPGTPGVAVPGIATSQPRGPVRSAEVQMRGNHLWVAGKRFFLRGIRHSGTRLRTLHDAGFNTVWLDESTPTSLIDEAARLGFWIVPRIRPPAQGEATGDANATELFSRKIGTFLEREAVLGWDLGSNLTAERFPDSARLGRAFRIVDPQRPVIADVWDGFRGYSRGIEQMLVGTHRWPLHTGMELPAYRDWLEQRRRLASDSFCWTWIQTHQPEWLEKLTAEPGPGGYREPVGPLPDQIRLLTYLALAAGYRGVAFWSDRYLADSHQGRDRLLAMALLNQELILLERLLLQSPRAPDWVPTSRPDVMAAVFRTPEGVLVLPIWIGIGSQFVPGQGSFPELCVTVPGVPNTATAWEVTAGRMRAHPITREIGGTVVKLRHFNLTTALLFTSDLGPTGMVVWLQDRQRRVGRLAAQWLHDQAKEQLTKVEYVQAALDGQNKSVPDAQALLKRAHKALETSMQHRRNGEHGEAYTHAELSIQALRILMRAQWDIAIRDLDSPVSSPYAISYYTLPRHWAMFEEIRHSQPAQSTLPHGDFELEPHQAQPGWTVHEVPTLDEVKVTVRRVDHTSHTGRQCLMVDVAPRDLERIPVALERSFVAVHTPAVTLPPGTLVRISAWIKMPRGMAGSPDGVMLFDSAGGEPLALRLAMPIPKWRSFSLYRKVPANGRINLSLAVSGMGTVYFDDVRIEPLVPAGK